MAARLKSAPEARSLANLARLAPFARSVRRIFGLPRAYPAAILVGEYLKLKFPRQ